MGGNEKHRGLPKTASSTGKGGLEMSGILGRMLGSNEIREDFKRRIDQLLEVTQKMLDADKEHVVALRDHAKAVRELRLTLKEIKESL